jgi:hypothetical protein
MEIDAPCLQPTPTQFQPHPQTPTPPNRPQPTPNQTQPKSDPDSVDDDLIKTAFKKAALQLHPDRHAATGSPEAVQAAAGRFQRLQVAYEVLRDPKRRKAYDRGQLHAGR